MPIIHYTGTSYANEAEGFISLLISAFSPHLDAHEETTATTATRFQPLLYFGLLNEIIGPINYEQYIKSEDGRKIITTKQLEKDIKSRFHAWKKIKRKEDRKVEILRVMRYIKGPIIYCIIPTLVDLCQICWVRISFLPSTFLERHLPSQSLTLQGANTFSPGRICGSVSGRLRILGQAHGC